MTGIRHSYIIVTENSYQRIEVEIIKVTVDRFEGDFAICEKDDRTMIQIEKSRLPDTVREGDIIVVEDEGIYLDAAATKERKSRIEGLMKDLWE